MPNPNINRKLLLFSGSGSSCFVILSGQSNARGQGTPFPSGYTGNIPNCKIFNGTTFETLNGSVTNNNQFGQPQGTYGTEMSLLKDLSTRYKTVYCMKYAVGGTGLASVAQGGDSSNWNTATVGGLYSSLVTYINSAKVLLPSNCQTLGLIWYQGEADGKTSTLADLYYSNLSSFVTSLRTATSLPSLKFYLTRVSNSVDYGVALSAPIVRMALEKYANNNYGMSYLINVDDLTFESDYTHLTAQSYIDLGLRYSSSLETAPSNLTIALSSDFAGTTISNKDWIVTGTNVSQNNKIILTNNHSGTVAFETSRKLTSRYVLASGVGEIWGRVKITWTDPTTTNESSGGFFMHTDTNNYVGVMTDVTVAGGNAMKIRKRVAGVNTDTSIAATNGSEFKIKYNTITGAYQIWYWTAGAWSSLGTGTGAVGRVKCIFTTNDSATFTGGDEYYFENFDVTIADFTTNRPTL